MNYKIAVERLIKENIIPKQRTIRGLVGDGVFEYVDRENEVVLVCWYSKDGELITDEEFSLHQIKLMYTKICNNN